MKNHSTNSRILRRSMLRRLGRLFPAFAASVLLTGVAHASPDEAPATSSTDTPPAAESPADQGAIEMSPFELAQLLRARIASYAIAPKATTRESSVRSAWRVSLKSRAGRMLARMKRVSNTKDWNVRGATLDTWTPKTEATARVLRDLAGLYAELSAAEKQIKKARIVEQKKLYFGHVPGRKGRKPTTEIDATGNRSSTERGFFAAGVFGPGPVIGGFSIKERFSTDRVRIKIYDREAEQRMRDAQQSKIDALVAGIRGRIDAYHADLTKDLELVRALTASVQMGEEMRLRQAAQGLADGTQRLAAQELLDEMRVGRFEARALVFNTASDYGRSLRKDWLQKRARLERLLDA